MIPEKPLREFTQADVESLIGQPESDQVEYKQALPAKGNTPDRWYQGDGAIGSHAKERLFSEIVAMANSHGGYLFLGIEETDEKPPRAKTLAAVPRCEELAALIAQSAADSIEPKLPVLDVQPIRLCADGSGVVVMRTMRSAIGPHRLKSTKECYVRRQDRCEVLSMREIQDLAVRTHRQNEEGLWTVEFGVPPNAINGGVVVLEAGRLFGGDSQFYYEGHYESLEGKFSAEFRVVHYHGDPYTAFGDRAKRFTVYMRGERKAEQVVGTLSRSDIPQMRPSIRLTRRANLP